MTNPQPPNHCPACGDKVKRDNPTYTQYECGNAFWKNGIHQKLDGDCTKSYSLAIARAAEIDQLRAELAAARVRVSELETHIRFMIFDDPTQPVKNLKGLLPDAQIAELEK